VVLDSDAPLDSPEGEQPPNTVLTQVLEQVTGERDRLVRQVEEQAAMIRRQEERIDRLTTEKQETIDRLTVLLQQAQQGRQPMLTQALPMDTQPITQTATQAATRRRPRSLWIRLLDALRGP
jgi:septal ring factor EnvC (AmiA/AmiB activator)